MLEQLSKNSEIQGFLDNFPKHQWRKCIEGTMLFGIRKLKEQSRKIVFQDILNILGESQEDTIRKALSNMYKEIEEISGTIRSIESRPKIDQNLKIPRISTSELEGTKPLKRESPIRSTSRSKQPPSVPRQGSYGTLPKSTDRKIPKYLKNVQSKIKEDVHKDIAIFNHKPDSRPSSANDYDLKANNSRELKEPNVIPLDKIRKIKYENSDIAKLADDYSANPFASYLTGGYKYH